MRMKDAARRFNDALATDAYTGEELFRCQFTSFDDHAASGATARRRVLGLPEGTEIPTRSAINLYSEIWLVGSGTADSFAGSIIRMAYAMRRATDLAKLSSPGNALLTTDQENVFIQKQFFKDTYNTLTESASSIAWNVFLSPHETVPIGSFFVTSDMTLRVRKTYLPVEGLRVAECDELDYGSLVSAVFIESGTYDSANDSYATIAITTPAYIIDYNKLYQLATAKDEPYQPGDLTILVPQSLVTPVVGTQLTLNGKPWRVLTTQPELDCWLLHIRLG